MLEGIGKCKKKKNKNLVELCTSFKNLRGIWENHQVLSSKIAVANIKKKEFRGTTLKDEKVRSILNYQTEH